MDWTRKSYQVNRLNSIVTGIGSKSLNKKENGDHWGKDVDYGTRNSNLNSKYKREEVKKRLCCNREERISSKLRETKNQLCHVYRSRSKLQNYWYCEALSKVGICFRFLVCLIGGNPIKTRTNSAQRFTIKSQPPSNSRGRARCLYCEKKRARK